ncbi:NAD-dependent epimerase/dehydratase family protein [Kurthia massiliensis]|uniref:NAD-dependent epimerase/dehydratase family protein n=1 Tax=Kurthia massiliensis TaxID=1033739 RepID=UPI000287D5E2|nr:NAD-dependent epimerase/dehydratase family protein [Kurthia massiliensis]
MLFVTGLSGNTGQALFPHIRHENIVTVSRQKQTFPHNVICHEGDLDDRTFIESLFQKYQFTEVIHIANIRYTKMIIELAEKYRVQRVIAIHTTGVYSKYRSCSALYEEIEQTLQKMALTHTSYVILRPTMIYGNERDHNMQKLIRFLAQSPAFPIFGDGQSMLQPVHVKDLAAAIATVYARKDIQNDHFDLSGGSIISYKELITFLANALDRRVYVVPVPFSVATACVRLYNLLPNAIISTEQVLRLQEHKVYSHEKAKRVFGYQPRSLEEGLLEEVFILQQKGLIS